VKAAGLLALLPLLAGAPQGRPSGVILIITDDQGYGDLGCHGNPDIRTPHLDRLAAQSVVVDRFHVMPVCSPTRACLMTGRYNYRTGVVDTYIGRSMMHSDEVTIAEMLAAAGYRTGIFGKWHLGDNYPLRAIDQGFQEALTLKGGGIGQPSDPPGGDRYQDPTLYRNGKPVKTKGYVTDVLTDAAIDFVSASRDRPFFATIAYNAPHTPLEVPPGSLERYRALPDATAKVYAMVTNIDDNLGRLFARLDELKLAENTMVIFITDNGPQQDRYVAGMRGRKGSVFEGGIRVPCFVRWPAALKPGRKVDRIAAHIDLAPTILEACGAAPPAQVKLDGVSLLPLLRGDKVEWADRTLFFQWHRGDQPEKGRACAALGERWKLVRQQPSAPAMLFDLAADPGEKTDLASANPEVVRSLSEAYEKWFADVSATRGYAPPRIHVGSERENPALLTRQDWRGAKAGWDARSQGHWEIEVARAGTYDVRLIFRGGASKARLAVAGLEKEIDLPPGAGEITFPELALPAGPARLEPFIVDASGTRGVDYAEVRRTPP
jgi:arylsulfatase A-like enzyme